MLVRIFKANEIDIVHYGHNILNFFDIKPKFLAATKEKEFDY